MQETVYTILYNDNEGPISYATAMGACISRSEEIVYVASRRIQIIKVLSAMIANFDGTL